MWTTDVTDDVLLFSDLQPADKASSMPHEQRKVHAEKVSICLMKFLSKRLYSPLVTGLGPVHAHSVSWLCKR